MRSCVTSGPEAYESERLVDRLEGRDDRQVQPELPQLEIGEPADHAHPFVHLDDQHRVRHLAERWMHDLVHGRPAEHDAAARGPLPRPVLRPARAAPGARRMAPLAARGAAVEPQLRAPEEAGELRGQALEPRGWTGDGGPRSP